MIGTVEQLEYMKGFGKSVKPVVGVSVFVPENSYKHWDQYYFDINMGFTDSVTGEDVRYNSGSVISFSYHFEGTLFSSVMRCLDLELKFNKGLRISVFTKGQHVSGEAVEINSKTVNCLIGQSVSLASVEIDSEPSKIPYANFVIYKAQWKEESGTVVLTCYDSMLKTMIPYDLKEEYNTPYDLLCAISNRIFKTVTAYPQLYEENSDEWINANEPIINSSKYSAVDEETGVSNFTFRDVLDDIAELMACNIIFTYNEVETNSIGNKLFEGNNAELKLVYPKDTGVTISCDNLSSLALNGIAAPYDKIDIQLFNSDVHRVYSKTDGCVNILSIENNPIISSDSIEVMNSRMENIYNQISKEIYNYELMEIKNFGLGVFEFGDIITVLDKNNNPHKMLITSGSFSIMQSVTETLISTSSIAQSDIMAGLVNESFDNFSTVSSTERRLSQLGDRVAHLEGVGTVLWEGAYYMFKGENAVLDSKISEQVNGIVLVFAPYNASTATVIDYGYICKFIPKWFVTALNVTTHTFELTSSKFGSVSTKYLRITDTQIEGYVDNNQQGSSNGITYDNRAFVLRYVLGV